MPLKFLELSTDIPAMSAQMIKLLRDAENRIDSFFEDEKDKPLRGFLPSDYELVYKALSVIERDRLALGNRFCEWGSGFGVVACMASLLGFESYGLEFQADLVEHARQLASDHNLDVKYACETFVPSGFDFYTEGVAGTKQLMHTADGDHVHPGIDVCAEEFDVIFVYPWPGEMEFVHDLFDAADAEGALLVSYQGPGDLTVHRRIHA